jgi:LuxR family maltose regulon positive regulatory protein
MAETAVRGRVASVAVGRDERDPLRFWLAVLGALRQTDPGATLVRPLTAAPDMDGWAIAERLMKDLARLEDRIWLVIDDVHELNSGEALRQLELLIMRGPQELRFILATRHDVQLGLHRLRLEGELTELRTEDLRFTFEEARELLRGAAVELAEPTLALLYERTEGWAAGLRLAALSLAGHPGPERLAAEFSGSERTVAEYLLAEVLGRHSPEVQRLLLRTSVLEQVNGELADLLTGGSGGERVLQDLEDANAFVVALDAARSWFRYHHLFSDLLQRELRRTAPGEVAGLHRRAAEWLSGHGFPAEAVRQAQAAGDWAMATRLLADNKPGLHLAGQAATVHALLAQFPAEASAADPELAGLVAADELARGSLETAERYLRLAERGSASVEASRRGQFQVLLGVVRLQHARQRGNLPKVAREAQALQALAEAPLAAQLGLGEEMRALALISLGSTEVWTTQFEPAERHLDQGIALARRIGRPFLEFTGLAYLAAVEIYRSAGRAAERSMQAIELARQHGWTEDPAAGIAYLTFGSVLVGQGRPEEAEAWVQLAERTVTEDTEPAARLAVQYLRGRLELGRGRDADALAAFRAAERLAERLDAPNLVLARARGMLLYIQARLGDTEAAERILAGFGSQDRDRGEVRTAAAALRLAQGNPRAALAVLAPVVGGAAPALPWGWLPHAFLLEAIARDALGDPVAADRALERALDLAEPDGALFLFLLDPAPGLLKGHARRRTAHGVMIAEILSLLAGHASGAPSGMPQPPLAPLSRSEIRVLRYLPTNLSMPEIAHELSVSHNTIRTHMRHLYAKLGTHRRADTVARARSLGLLAPTPLKGVGQVRQSP